MTQQAKYQEITIDLDQFTSTYKPVQNHINKDASWGGIAFETYGPEFQHVALVQKESPSKVWSIVECDESDEMIITSGFHYVNCFGYVITEDDAPENAFVTVED